MGNILPEFGDLLFTMVIGYLGALELMYVVRHLYHWSFHTADSHGADANNLQDLQENLRNQLVKAEDVESKAAGRKVMRDGVQYEDGFRVDPQKTDKDKRREELEKEFAKQKQIEEETRKQLREAEEELEKQRKAAEVEKQKAETDAANNESKLLEAERLAEEKQRKLELEEEEAEYEGRILDSEREAEAKQRQMEIDRKETEENERYLLERERQRELEQKAQEEEEDRKAAEIVFKLLEAEREREERENKLLQKEKEEKQRMIEENARKFLEAEEEMVQLQQQMQQAAAGNDGVVEEMCVKKDFKPHYQEQVTKAPTIKTQFNQASKMFAAASDEGSSIEPNSSEQSSFSNQNSEDATTANEEITFKVTNEADETIEPTQYSEDYLRSLDGIKQKPLMREDGSGRRRAFKKRRSSGSSNSSRDSRTSRDEELRMFTSLEEEEMSKSTKDDEDYVPIKYSTEPNLKVKTHRRHKRSPAKDAKTSDDSLRNSLERLGEENVDPWGEVMPETYRNTEFWRREKAMSIDEEVIELPSSMLKQANESKEAVNTPHTSSFEEANTNQNEKAIQKLKSPNEETETLEAIRENVQWETQVNLKSSSTIEQAASPARSSASPGLRRSPRIDEMDHYEERWSASKSKSPQPNESSSSQNLPKIEIQKSKVDNEPWRDQYGLLMEGISDFYDFQASVNPSRSRSTSRTTSPTIKKVSFENGRGSQLFSADVDVYDDTGNFNENEFSKESICYFMTSINNENSTSVSFETIDSSNEIKLQLVSDDQNREKTLLPTFLIKETNESNEIENFNSSDTNDLVLNLRTEQLRSRAHSPIPTADNLQRSLDLRRTKKIQQNDELFEKHQNNSLQEEKTTEYVNLNQSKGAIPKILTPTIMVESSDNNDCQEDNNEFSKENMSKLVETLRIQQSRSRSKSPLPTAQNLNKSLEKRRQKLIHKNDELFERMQSKVAQTPEIQVEYEYVYEKENEEKAVDNVVIYRSRTPSRSPCKIYSIPSIKIENTLAENDNLDQDSKDVSDLVESLKVHQRSRSRSKSPLPTAKNLEKSIQKRKQILIEKNDEFIEKILESNLATDIEVQYVYEFEQEDEACSMEETQESKVYGNMNTYRSRTPSRSPSKNYNLPSISIENTEVNDIKINEKNLSQDMSMIAESLRVQRSHSRSKSPLPAKNLKKQLEHNKSDDELRNKEEQIETPCTEPIIFIESHEDQSVCNTQDQSSSKTSMSQLIQSLRVDRSRSHSRSPLPTPSNLKQSLEKRRNKLIQRNDELFEQLLNIPAKTPQVEMQYIIQYEDNKNESIQPTGSNSSTNRSRTPSRSMSPNNKESTLEVSKNDALVENSKLECDLHERQYELDMEALQKLKNAEEEIELRTISSQYERTNCDSLPEKLKRDQITGTFKRSTYVGESLEIGSEFEPLRKELSEFERSQSPSPSCSRIEIELARQTARLNREMQNHILSALTEKSNETLNASKLEMELECLRQETAEFKRSQSRSRSPLDELATKEVAAIEAEATRKAREDDLIDEFEYLREETAEFRRSASKSRSPLDESALKEIAEIEAEVVRKTREDDLIDEIEYLREINAEFRRSASKSRSPIDELTSRAITVIEAEAARKAREDDLLDEIQHLREEISELKRSVSKSRSPANDIERETITSNATEANLLENIKNDDKTAHYDKQTLKNENNINNNKCTELDCQDSFKMYLESECLQEKEFECSTSKNQSPFETLDKVEVEAANFQNFTRHLNVNFLENERRASDSAALQKHDNFNDVHCLEGLDPDEYHHFRRYSLFQELPMEDYPSDDEVYSNKGSSHWVYEDFYSEDYDEMNIDDELINNGVGDDDGINNANVEDDEDNMSAGSYDVSDDDRRTVVEVEDEIDTDICDFSEKGPTSHSQSECEEADREVDRYANHQIGDWQEPIEQQVASGLSYDSDSFVIDQIYDDAIRNRKQSGILKDFDNILEDMQKNYSDNNFDNENDNERYALWSKTRALEKMKHSTENGESTCNSIDLEKQSNEIRYLGDADSSARQSVRLRSRYGFVPVLQTTVQDDEVDLNYKPKKEYNWRKNFKIDDDDNSLPVGKETNKEQDIDTAANSKCFLEERKFSLGGESITLFSQSPEREVLESVAEESHIQEADTDQVILIVEEDTQEKPKKKKTKKKTRKDTKVYEDDVCKDEDDSESQLYGRRSSSLQMETDSPKRKSRSRRSSRSSNNSEDPNGLFSPRSSVGQTENISDIHTEIPEMSNLKKKTKKRAKKIKEIPSWETPQIKEETQFVESIAALAVPVSSTLTPQSSSANLLSTLSPKERSVCITPASSKESSVPRNISNGNDVDSFDILKDGNFYPLF